MDSSTEQVKGQTRVMPLIMRMRAAVVWHVILEYNTLDYNYYYSEEALATTRATNQYIYTSSYIVLGSIRIYIVEAYRSEQTTHYSRYV